MLAVLTIIGLGVVLWWVSKGLKKLGALLTDMSNVISDLGTIHNKKIQNNKPILRQNKIAEENLQTITGEKSHVAYNYKIRREIDEIIQDLNARTES